VRVTKGSQSRHRWNSEQYELQSYASGSRKTHHDDPQVWAGLGRGPL